MIEALLTKFAAGRRPPVTTDQLDEAQDRLAFHFPERLSAFYRQSDGLLIVDRWLVLNSLAEGTRYAEAIGDIDLPHYLGLFPLSESNDSNPYCIACKPPLSGRIIHLRHDDAPRLAYRNLDEFAAALVTLSPSGRCSIDNLVLTYDVDHTDRTSDDDAVAEELLAGSCPDVENAYAIAMALFSRQRIGKLIELLDHESMWVREDAASHLERMGDVAAIEALSRLASGGEGQDNRAAQRSLKTLNRIKSGKES